MMGRTVRQKKTAQRGHRRRDSSSFASRVMRATGEYKLNVSQHIIATKKGNYSRMCERPAYT